MSETVNQLLDRAALARRENRPIDADQDLLAAIGLCRESNLTGPLIRGIKSRGQIARDRGDAGAAKSLYEEAVAVARTGSDGLTLAHTLRHLGEIHQELGEWKPAEDCLIEALAIYQSNPNTSPLDLANTIRPLAILYSALGRNEESLRLWNQARELYATCRVQAGVAECLAWIARLS